MYDSIGARTSSLSFQCNVLFIMIRDLILNKLHDVALNLQFRIVDYSFCLKKMKFQNRYFVQNRERIMFKMNTHFFDDELHVAHERIIRSQRLGGFKR